MGVMDPVERLVNQVGQLYSLPRVAMQVLELTRDEQVDARKLKEVIENDPALTGKILRVVNSSLFGLSREVRDLNQALALLGTKPLKLLVLGFSLPGALTSGQEREFFARYWQRTLIRAVAAREISRAAWSSAGDEAFLAGLLEDLGLLVLVRQLGEPYADFVVRAWDTGADLAKAERSSLGFDHRQLTAALLRRWRLPESLIAAAQQDSPTAEGTPGQMRSILSLAHRIADFLGDRRLAALGAILATAQQEHALPPLKVQRLLETLQEKVDHLASVLSLELPPGRNYLDVVSQGHAQLAAAADNAALEWATREMAGAKQEQEASLWQETQELSHALDNLLNRGPAAETPAAHQGGNAAGKPSLTTALGRPSSAHPSATIAAESTNGGRAPCSPRTGHDPALAAELSAAAARCRTDREPLTLLLVELDRADDYLFEHGPGALGRATWAIDGLCQSIESAVTHWSREGCLAVVLAGADRRAGAAAGQQILASVRQLSTTPESPGISVSVGVASIDSPPKNFSARDMIASADRCLDAAQLSGGNCLKSIESY